MRALAKGATQPNLNMAIVKNLKIPLIPREEQIEWVTRMEQIGSAIRNSQGMLGLQRDLSRKLLVSLFGREE